MTSKQRFLTALNRGCPDRLPVTTHHLMPSFLEQCMDGASPDDFFKRFGLDPIRWVHALRPHDPKSEYLDPDHQPGCFEARRVISNDWRIEAREEPHREYHTVGYEIVTPSGTLSTVLQSDAHTTWVAERFVKEKDQIEIIAKHAPRPLCDTGEVNRLADEYGERGLIRGTVPGFDVYGQPGCWQDAAVLFGIEELILATFDDPGWVHEFLAILQDRKRYYISSLADTRFDLIELGGGDASSSVISPAIFEEFVARYDAPLIDLVHGRGQRVVYHTCGGMMPFLEMIADMRPDAMETFTPASMGGDTLLAEAKTRIGNRVCMIGGFDQNHFFRHCSPEETRREVRRCFEEAGSGGGYILAPSDHFFDAEFSLIEAYSDEAKKCFY